MAFIQNFTSTRNNWRWTGVNTLNQAWSYIYVPEGITVNQIDVNWGGYDAPTSGRHFIAKVGGTNGTQLRGVVAISNTLSVPQGRAWRYAKITPTYLPAGHYVVGVWGNPKGRRVYSEWNGNRGTTLYEVTKLSGFDGNALGKAYQDCVIPSRLHYVENEGKINIKDKGIWRKGQAFIKDKGIWRKAKAVYIKDKGIWRKSK